ncbi:hypothetical protein H6P81_004836 [Aristolochia fimbriata]|uniref:Uncharacterized protein n=1 Tax=Aristolochia fimbriata TaxID=158543 RepID=A0AAV7EWD2_ARIFI|nr:hypothetical protein H6P81_004836 [Aristolochia fimbriata]
MESRRGNKQGGVGRIEREISTAETGMWRNVIALAFDFFVESSVPTFGSKSSMAGGINSGKPRQEFYFFIVFSRKRRMRGYCLYSVSVNVAAGLDQSEKNFNGCSSNEFSNIVVVVVVELPPCSSK